MARVWAEATPEEQRDTVRVTLEAVWCDPSERSILYLKPEPKFLLLFALCEGIKQEGVLIYPSESFTRLEWWREFGFGRRRREPV